MVCMAVSFLVVLVLVLLNIQVFCGIQKKKCQIEVQRLTSTILEKVVVSEVSDLKEWK